MTTGKIMDGRKKKRKQIQTQWKISVYSPDYRYLNGLDRKKEKAKSYMVPERIELATFASLIFPDWEVLVRRSNQLSYGTLKLA